MVFDVMNLEEIATEANGHGPDANWNGTADGEMLFLRKSGEDPPPERSAAKISSPYYRDAGAGCVFALSYYVGGVTDYRHLSVTIKMANASAEQKIDHIPEPINNTVSSTTWPRKTIGIGRRVGHFAVSSTLNGNARRSHDKSLHFAGFIRV